MKKNYRKFSRMRTVLVSFAMATVTINGYAQYPRTVALNPVEDIQFRSTATNIKGNAPSFEMHPATTVGDYGFVAGLKFDLTGILAAGETISSATLRLTCSQALSNIVIYPFSTDWGETGGTTDSWTAKQAYITAAIASAPVVASFRPINVGGQKIFEFTNFTRTIADYQTTVDVTAYIQNQVAIPQDVIALLLAPDATTGTANYSIIFSKDVSASTYDIVSGTTSMTNGYNDDGTRTSTTANDVTRWSRIEQLLRLSGNAPVSELYPLLTLTIVNNVNTGMDKTTVNKEVISTTCYDLTGRQVSKEAAKGGVLLQKVIYKDGSVSYHKIIVTR